MAASLRRPLAVAAVLFVLILAFLAGRVHAGADPYGRSLAPPQGAAPAPGGLDLDPPVTQAS